MCQRNLIFCSDISSHPTALQVQEYLIDYTKHFGLGPSLRLSTSIQSITFDEARSKWILHTEGSDEMAFDKVVLAGGGMVGAPSVPLIEGIEKFEGIKAHSQSFKRPEDYVGKRVMVIGFGNSAADTSTQLVGIADKVYLSHRHGARVVSSLCRLHSFIPMLIVIYSCLVDSMARQSITHIAGASSVFNVPS